MPHVGVIFDDVARPEMTGGHALRALQCLTEAMPLRPDQLTAVDPVEFRLFLRVDDGLEYPVPHRLRPLAWWAIDTHLSFERCLRQARRADFVFAAQQNGAEQLRAAGITAAQWLPLACDPVTQGWRSTPNQYDVAFVGNIFPGERAELLQLIQKNIPRSFLGRADYRRLGEIYSSAKIVFNSSLRDDMNMRVFEGLCSGSLLITNDLAENGQNDLFTPGEHLVTYRSPGELLEKMAYYLEHETERQQIARAGGGAGSRSAHLPAPHAAAVADGRPVHPVPGQDRNRAGRKSLSLPAFVEAAPATATDREAVVTRTADR